MTYLAIPGALLMLLALPASAAMNDWDVNDDSVVDPAEFREGFDSTDMFTSWDTDGDGVLSEEEFENVVHRRYDIDGDGTLNEAELEQFERAAQSGEPAQQ